MKNHEDLLAAAKGMLNRDDPPLHAVPDPAEGEGETTQPMAVVPAAPAVPAGRQMGAVEQARHQARYSLTRTRGTLRELRHREGSIAHALYHGRPPSMAMQAEYAKSRAWVKPGHEGGFADREGAAFQAVIGKPGVALGLAIAGACSRQVSFWIAYGTALFLAELCLYIRGLHTTALWVALVHVALIGAVFAAAAFTSRRGEDEGDDETAETTEPATEPEEG